MLDKTIPFYNTILKCSAYEPEEVRLPKGYSFACYRDGFEKDWARLECEIGDFDTAEEAEAYFKETYLCERERLIRKSVFLIAPDGEVIGSCFAWTDDRRGEKVSSVHWLVVDERCQGRGLGRCLMAETMKLFDTMPVYIHTQPWSWKAVLLYVSMGFRLQKTDAFSHYENQTDDALKTLKTVLTQKQYDVVVGSLEK